MKPLEKFEAERKEQIAKGIGLEGSEGAFYRLMEKLDTVEVTNWIGREAERGTPVPAIATALSNHIVNMLAPLCLGRSPVFTATVIMMITDGARRVMSGEAKLEVLAVHRKDGRQHMTTAEGIAKHGYPK